MNFAAKQHQYWNNLNNPSMPDKYAVELEVKAIKKRLGPGKLLDVGCGEGENTIKFTGIKGISVTGVDYAVNRIKLARKSCPKAKFILADLTKTNPKGKYDYIVSQRFLINLPNWKNQKSLIEKLVRLLNPKGKLILCEGSLQGVEKLNQFRAKLKLEPIPIRWHNTFINDHNLEKMGLKLVDGFGGYYLLTRGVRPFFDQELNWDSRFNRLAKSVVMPHIFSRIKVWEYLKP